MWIAHTSSSSSIGSVVNFSSIPAVRGLFCFTEDPPPLALRPFGSRSSRTRFFVANASEPMRSSYSSPELSTVDARRFRFDGWLLPSEGEFWIVPAADDIAALLRVIMGRRETSVIARDRACRGSPSSLAHTSRLPCVYPCDATRRTIQNQLLYSLRITTDPLCFVPNCELGLIGQVKHMPFPRGDLDQTLLL
jgi:hypothetical protein